MHGGRDILNLGANIRPSFNWEITDRKLSRHEIQNIIANRSVYYRLREQSLNDYSMVCIHDIVKSNDNIFYSPYPPFPL